MALVVKDRVRETSTTTGTGALTLNGAVTGFQSFSVIGDGNTTYYTIVDAGTGAWEVGIGTYTLSTTSLARDTVLESSNSGSLVNFGSNLKDVFVTYPAERSIYTDAAGTAITPATASVLGVASGGTGQSTYTNGQLLIGNTTGNTLTKATLTAGTGITVTNGTGSISIAATNNGDVVGPASSTDNAVARFDSTTGKIIQNSGVTIDDSNNVSGVAQLNATTVDATNIEVTNIKAKDGTASASIADSTGVFTHATTTVFPAGAVGTPSITTTGDTNTGIFFPAADTIGFAEGGVEAMRIDSSGRVGIGVTPSLSSAKLTTVGGPIQLSGGTTSQEGIRIQRASGYASIQGINNDNNAFNPIAFFTSGSEAMRVDSSGNLLFQATNNSDTVGVGLKFKTNVNVPYLINVTNDSIGSNYYLLYNTNATNNGYRFYVQANGGVANFSGNNTNLSDERTKHNIELSGSYLDKICAIPVKTFNYKDEPVGEQKTLGVIAQDVEAIAPEFVNNEGFGETKEGEEPLKSVYITDMMFAMMKAIQELKAELDTVKAELATLKGN